MNVPSEDIESGGFSHIGPVREENQDSICWSEDHPETCASLFAVADGMCGYNNGKLASSLALENVFETFKTHQGSPAQQLKRGIEAANLAIYQATQRLGAGRMGTWCIVRNRCEICCLRCSSSSSRRYPARSCPSGGRPPSRTP